MSLNRSQLHQDKVKTESQSYQKKNPNVQSLEIELDDDAVAYYRDQGYLVEYVDGGDGPFRTDGPLAKPQGDIYLPFDGTRPSYTDASGEERSEYKIGVEFNGKEYVIPTVWDGEQHTEDEAVERYFNTGEHMGGPYGSIEEGERSAKLRTFIYNNHPAYAEQKYRKEGGNIPPEQEAYQKKMKEGEPNMVHRNANWAAKIRSGLPVEYANYNDEQIRELYDKQNIVGAEPYKDEMIPSYQLPEVDITSSGIHKSPYWNQLPEHTKKTILDFDPSTEKMNPMVQAAMIKLRDGHGMVNPKTGKVNETYTEELLNNMVYPGLAVAAVPLAMQAAPTVWGAANANLLGLAGTSALDAAGLYGGYQGAKHLPGHVSEFAEDPSWKGAGKIGLDALGIAGGAYSAGKLLKNLPGAQFLGKTTAGSAGSGNLNSGFNPEKISRYTNRTNQSVDEFGQARNFAKDFNELPHYPDNTNFEEILTLAGKRGSELDDFAKANPNWMPTKESFKYLGTNTKRPFIQMNTPVGNQTFYRSSGLGNKAGSSGKWIPFEAYMPNGTQPRWFMKSGSRGAYKDQPMNTIFRPNKVTGEQESVDVATQLKEQGIDGIEALRSGELKLDFPGYDFNYTANPESMIHSIANSGMLDDAYNAATAFKQYGGYRDGGSTEPEYMYLELDDDAIQQYRDGGWVVDVMPEYEEGGIISPGDGWEYKQEGDTYFTKKEGATDWIDTTGNTKAREAIKSKIYKEPTIVNNTIIDPTIPNNITTDNATIDNTVPNSSIVDIQTKLVDAGYNIGYYGDGKPLIDGDFGTKTKAALDNYNKGIAPEPIKTPTKLNKENKSSNEIYEKSPLTKVSEIGDMEDGFLPIITDYGAEVCSKQGGCSYNASKKMGTVLKGSVDDLGKLWAEDAWFNKSRMLQDEGSLIYNTEDRDYLTMPSVPKELYGKLQVGDYVHLNRPDTSSSKKYAAKTKKNLTNEGIEHIGFIIGRDEDGTPLVWHGSESGHAYVQRIDGAITLETEDLDYKISSIVRNPEMKNLNEEAKQMIQNNSYYKPYDSNIKLVPTRKSTEAQVRGFDAVNDSMEYFKKQGYDQKDVAMVGQLLVGGIMQNESSGDESDYRSWVKQPGAYLLKDMAGTKKAFEGDQASWGVYQMKPDYNFKNPDGSLNKMGKKLQDTGIEVDEIFDDVSYQTIAGMLILLENYSKLKKDKRFDAETGLYNGNLPTSYMLAKSWQAGSGWQNRDKYQKWIDAADVTYSENALKNAARTSKVEGVDYDLSHDSAASLNVKHADDMLKLAELYNTEEAFDPNVKIDLQTQYNQPTSESSNINLPVFKQYSQVNLPSTGQRDTRSGEEQSKVRGLGSNAKSVHKPTSDITSGRPAPNLHRRNYRKDGGENNSPIDRLKDYILKNL